DTSFVLFPDQEGPVILSARSMGDVNVQVVLEKLGGGGNAATAGAQVPDKTVDEVTRMLLQAIDQYLENDKANQKKDRITMKVILKQDVKGQGKKGQLIEASDGYARNFLLPRKLAVPATAENINTMKMQEKAKKAQEAAEKAEAEATAARLKELTVKVVAKGGNGGR